MRYASIFYLAAMGGMLLIEASECPSAMAQSNNVTSQPPQVDSIAKLAVQHLPNAVRVHERVISGGLPEGEAAFKELSSMGIKTIISVDGAKPNLELAAKFGLRYVHMPHGYDGISAGRGFELAKAVRELPGPIYIHCHHGKHRSPAAAAVACLGAGFIQSEQAAQVLLVAGTSTSYRGLFRSVAEAKVIDSQQLDAALVEYPEVAQLPALAEAMVEMEHYFDQLGRAERNGWPVATGDGVESPSHWILMLREQYAELLRTDDLRSRPEDYQRWMKEGETLCLELEASLKRTADDTESIAERKRLLGALQSNCKTCHQAHRDNASKGN